MRKLPALSLAVTLALSIVAPASAAPSPPSDVDGANGFGFAMYSALKTQRGNLFFSATSMREALGVAYLGAGGNTAKEMSTTLRLDADPKASAALAKTEIADFASARGAASLDIANRLWADQTLSPSASFTSAAAAAYGSPVASVDFLRRPDDARRTVNGWVEKATHDRIKDLLPPGSVSSDTRLVITNAIWFKGTWEKAFTAAETRNETFMVDGTTSAQVPMMHQTAVFGFAQVDGAKVLEMKYDKSDLAMDVVLPDTTTGLSAIEGKLSTTSFTTWTAALTKQKVDVSFPKVTFTWGGSVKEPLRQLGMQTPFDPSRADFGGIAKSGGLVVSDVVHKAFVAIDEQGTEAAAATGVIMSPTTAVHAPPPAFRADHPFVVAIRDTKRGRILFLGRVTNPKT